MSWHLQDSGPPGERLSQGWLLVATEGHMVVTGDTTHTHYIYDKPSSLTHWFISVSRERFSLFLRVSLNIHKIEVQLDSLCGLLWEVWSTDGCDLVIHYLTASVTISDGARDCCVMWLRLPGLELSSRSDISSRPATAWGTACHDVTSLPWHEAIGSDGIQWHSGGVSEVDTLLCWIAFFCF